MNQELSIGFNLQKVSKYPGDLTLPPQKSTSSISNVGSAIFVSEREGGLTPLIEHLKNQRIKLIRLQNLKIDEIEGDKIAIVCNQASKNDEEIIDEIMSVLEPPVKTFYILTHNVLHLTGTSDFSFLYNRLDTYHVTADFKLCNLPSTSYDNETITEYLGNQYELTRRFLDRSSFPKDSIKLLSNLEEYIEDIIQNPPNYISHWIVQLKNLLKDPYLNSTFGEYMEDEIKTTGQNISQAEIRLYLAGWLRLNAQGDLRIRSIAHQRIAQSLLGGDR